MGICRRFAVGSAVFGLCVFGSAALAGAQAGDAAPAPQSAPAPDAVQAPEAVHAPPSSDRLNELARKLLATAMKTHNIARDNVKPWHIKIDFEYMQSPTAKKPETGSVEEWHASTYKWRRTYTSAVPEWTGSEWSASKTERYATKPRHGEFLDYFLLLRFTRPVIDPLYQVPNIRPQDPMAVQHVEKNGKAYNCTALATSGEGRINGWKANTYVPAMCFDNDLHLRIVQSDETTVLFDDYQRFQGKWIAHDVRILYSGALMGKMKVTLLETVESVDEALLKPGPDAVARPWVIETGFPQPVSVYEVGTVIPLMANGSPFRGTLRVPVILHKDGSVTVEHGGGGWLQPISDAVSGAVTKWKYKPYLVDGEPVEAEFGAPYPVDGKPFVPSYDRPSD